jgi:hypothetical protein
MLEVIPCPEILKESEVEAMTKGKALLLSIVCAATAIACFAYQEMTGMWAFASGAILFFSIWFYKYQRDYRIQAQARLERQSAARISLPTPSTSNLPYLSQAYVASLSREQYGLLLANYIQLGVHSETGEGFLVHHTDRCAGIYIVGNQGGGKTGLLENLIMQDILSGHSVIVIDPHGDLIQNCIATLPDELPKEWREKIFLLDMEDEEYPFGINVFGNVSHRSNIALAQSIERIVHIFEVLWPDVMSQAYLPRYLRAAIIVLFANPGSTLVDMYAFLTNDSVRRRMLQAVTDPSVRQFWQMQYDDLSPALRYQRLEPLVGRLESLFMGRTLVRNIVGQRQTSIDFRKAIENKEVIFIRLPLKTVGQDARLIGTLLIAQIHAAIFSFADMPESQRPGFSLYVDEFQHFATPDFSEMFTEGRKFGARVTVAHQYRSQLPDSLQASTMTARTKACFQVTPEDAREMAHLYIGGEATVRPEDIDPKPVEHLLHYDSDNFDVQMFVERYLLPLQSQKHSSSVEINHPGFRAEHIPFWVLNVEPSKDKPRVADPTPYLSHLLYQVMKTGNADIDIPSQIVYGFANCGRGFYSVFRYWIGKDKLLSPDVPYPPYLVVDAGSGLQWTRQPEDSKEELYCFLYHLRATMSHLAANPIGRKTNVSPSDIAQTLIQLPKRHALVRSGNHVGRIITDDTLPHMDEYTVLGNYSMIKVRTRQKYCRQVTASPPVNSNPPDEPPTVSRWEEV